jgi:hypothetical protein
MSAIQEQMNAMNANIVSRMSSQFAALRKIPKGAMLLRRDLYLRAYLLSLGLLDPTGPS